MMDRKQFRYPTPDEMIALTAAAHRNRSRQIRLMFRRGTRIVKQRLAHFATVPAPKRAIHA
jgi:hypothetical protein